MKSLSCLFVASMLVTGGAWAADAKGNAPTPSAGHEAGVHAESGQPADEFSTWDANHDGVLSKTELARHPKAAHMVMVDENRDGVLSRDEFAELGAM